MSLDNQTIQQAVVVDQESLKNGQQTTRFALFYANGAPIVFNNLVVSISHAIPLAASDVWQSEPVAIDSGYRLKLTASSDKPFGVREERSQEGVSFTLGPTISAVLFNGEYLVAFDVQSTTAYVRFTILNGSADMTRLQFDVKDGLV